MFRPAPSVPGTKILIGDIQTAFYNPILECILLDDSVTSENLRDKFQSALGIVVNKILELSKHLTDAIRLPNGIVLLHNKLLNKRNCPTSEGFDQLFFPLLDNLNKIAKIEGPQRQLLIRLCLSKAEPIPDELLSHRTKDVTDCAAIVNRVASVISQRDYFKVKITEVIKSYIEDCKSVSRRKP